MSDIINIEVFESDEVVVAEILENDEMVMVEVFETSTPGPQGVQGLPGTPELFHGTGDPPDATGLHTLALFFHHK